MATIGRFLDLFSSEFGRARGSFALRTQELRDGGILPDTRGGTGTPLSLKTTVDVFLMCALYPEYSTVAETVERVGAIPYSPTASHPVAFQALTVAGAPTVAEAMARLITDAGEGRLQPWRGDLYVDFVDSNYVEISTRRSTGDPGIYRESTLAYGHPTVAQAAPSMFRITRVDSRIFHRIAALMAGKIKPRITVD
jgi:hypothetical protein